MGYIADVQDFADGLGCGASCSCGPCRAGARLSESYVTPDDDDDDREGLTGVDHIGADRGMGAYAGLDMAVAVPVGVGISVGAALEAIAVVLAAIAAAYLLIKAYEAARARGFGIALAQSALSAGLGRLVSGARRLVEIIRRLIERARRLLSPRPQCAAAILALEQALAGIERTIAELVAEARSAVPRVPELNRLMTQLRQQASAIKGPLQAFLDACRT
jgi:hypothetical protein